jgi:hypothetical protein
LFVREPVAKFFLPFRGIRLCVQLLEGKVIQLCRQNGDLDPTAIVDLVTTRFPKYAKKKRHTLRFEVNRILSNIRNGNIAAQPDKNGAGSSSDSDNDGGSDSSAEADQRTHDPDVEMVDVPVW